jgi:hypothetical protein
VVSSALIPNGLDVGSGAEGTSVRSSEVLTAAAAAASACACGLSSTSRFPLSLSMMPMLR